MEWKTIDINIQNIATETDKAVLIKIPKNSDFKGYSFWHTKKLVWKGKTQDTITIGYNDDFNFALIKYGKGTWNKNEKISEIKIDIETFEKIFKSKNNKRPKGNHYSNNIVCPLCEEEHITHKEYNGTHIYICEDCPFIGLEYIDVKDAENLLDFLKNR